MICEKSRFILRLQAYLKQNWPLHTAMWLLVKKKHTEGCFFGHSDHRVELV